MAVERGNWSSRAGFVLAAVGCSSGLAGSGVGSAPLWRLPSPVGGVMMSTILVSVYPGSRYNRREVGRVPISAWIMLVFGCLVLNGGFFWCLSIALKKKGEQRS